MTTCKNCGSDFLPYKPKTKQQKFCKEYCRHAFWRKTHKTKVKEYNAKHYDRNRIRKSGDIEAVKKWQRENKEKLHAHLIVYRAVKSGKLIKPTICSHCKLKKRLHGHHKDYNKPLEVIWLCASCHKLLNF